MLWVCHFYRWHFKQEAPSVSVFCMWRVYFLSDFDEDVLVNPFQKNEEHYYVAIVIFYIKRGNCGVLPFLFFIHF